MTIVVTGGGSGGHITPILAVASELKRLRPDVRIVYIGQKGDSLGDIPTQDPNIDEAFTIRAGKLRRYHGEGWKQLLDLPTVYKNLRDAIYTLIGLYQSWRLMSKIKPSVVFTRGGFVSVPVALGAALRHVPYVTHDSDPVPSLANRIIAPWAKMHAVALPKELYQYPADKTVTTGIPLAGNFSAVNENTKQQFRQAIDVPLSAKLLFVIGGGLGSQRVNKAITEIAPHLIAEFADLYIAHVVGRANEDMMQKLYAEKIPKTEQGRVRIFGYISDVYRYSGAADVIVTRAGATNLAEFALQGKACIIIPSPFLTGGHQLKNAQVLAESEAAMVIDEVELQADPNRLAKQLSSLLREPQLLTRLASNLASFAKPNATHELATLLLDITEHSESNNK